MFERENHLNTGHLDADFELYVIAWHLGADFDCTMGIQILDTQKTDPFEPAQLADW